MAIASLVLGIISLVIAVFGGIASWVGSVCGILAIIFGVVGKKNLERKSMSSAGLTMGIISLCWGVISTVACIACIGATGVVTIPELLESVNGAADVINSELDSLLSTLDSFIE